MSILLPDLPELVLAEVVKYCGFTEIQVLRKTCWTLRNFIDDEKPELDLQIIEISIKLDSISLSLQFPFSQINLEYKKFENNGCQILWDRSDEIKLKILENLDHFEAFLTDFGVVLSQQKSILPHFWIYFNDDSIIDFPTQKNSIQVKNLVIKAATPTQIQKILQKFCPESLKSLELAGPGRRSIFMDLSEIFCLEQWKKAKKLEMTMIELGQVSIENFGHFQLSKVLYQRVEVEHVVGLKEIFLTSTHLKKYKKYFQLHWIVLRDYQEFFEALGRPPLSTTDEFNVTRFRWYFRIPEDSEKLLLICLYTRMFEFKFIDMVGIPKNAVIFD